MAKVSELDKKMKDLSIEDDDSMFKPAFDLYKKKFSTKTKFTTFQSILRRFQKDKNCKSKFTYADICKWALLSEHWAEIDFAEKNTQVTGKFFREKSFGFSYVSDVADRLSIGAKVDFFFEGKPVRFEITKIEGNKMQMKIDNKKKIQMVRGYPEKVKIIVNDSLLRKGHRQLEKVDEKMLQILFPISRRKAFSYEPSLNPKHLFNKQLNTQQIKCVERILNGKKNPQPFILFGPPGTGEFPNYDVFLSGKCSFFILKLN